jgi:hypothetical protein
VRRSNFAVRVQPNVVQRAMRHASLEAKQRYQMGMVEHVRENKQTVCCGMFWQAKASFLVSNPPRQRICTIARPFVFLKS